MVGVSRGAMQMFASLAHSDYVAKRVDKAVSISGSLDLNVTMNRRFEMRNVFKKKFKKQKKHKSFKDWLKYRNPPMLAPHLSENLKVLLIYGMNDNRVALEQQENFLSALQKQGISSAFVKFPDADHFMSDHIKQVKNAVLNFLRKKSTTAKS
ncbi:prolyl oligopeptidase family serine peptidase [Sulfobacillus acidophilus]|uniref:Prolyl oligopeptidase family serine peptidase n=1 Tax=Sulfobacillus acidophilus TaxID=53633 RepID=A0ABS3AWV0_9FIRM|nr:prolyl oligopeptidase family serine peptidase [Sulfobacillus acidophilus]